MANVGYTIRVWSTGSVRYTIANHLRWVRTLVGVTDLIHRHLTWYTPKRRQITNFAITRMCTSRCPSRCRSIGKFRPRCDHRWVMNDLPSCRGIMLRCQKDMVWRCEEMASRRVKVNFLVVIVIYNRSRIFKTEQEAIRVLLFRGMNISWFAVNIDVIPYNGWICTLMFVSRYVKRSLLMSNFRYVMLSTAYRTRLFSSQSRYSVLMIRQQDLRKTPWFAVKTHGSLSWKW